MVLTLLMVSSDTQGYDFILLSLIKRTVSSALSIFISTKSALWCFTLDFIIRQAAAGRLINVN